METRSRNYCCRIKALSNTCSECVSISLVTQHRNRMRHIMLPFVACTTVQCFFHIISKTIGFSEEIVTEHKMHVLIVSTTFL